jgi:hypothetical protein
MLLAFIVAHPEKRPGRLNSEMLPALSKKMPT